MGVAVANRSFVDAAACEHRTDTHGEVSSLVCANGSVVASTDAAFLAACLRLILGDYVRKQRAA